MRRRQGLGVHFPSRESLPRDSLVSAKSTPPTAQTNLLDLAVLRGRTVPHDPTSRNLFD